MVPNGIFVRAGLDGLAEEIVQRLSGQGPLNLQIEVPGSGEPGVGKACVRLSRWSETWCHLEVQGAQEGIDLLLESLVAHDPFEEVLTCHFKPEAEEYGYVLYRSGQVMEKFDSRGPGIESIHFISEMRRVPLQTLMSASQFMIASITEHNVHEDDRVDGGEKILIDLTLPDKPTFFQSLLGAASKR
jgi:hypothetical protein